VSISQHKAFPHCIPDFYRAMQLYSTRSWES